MRFAGLVLCGGFSRRMGRDKASLRLGGRTLLQLTVGRLAGLFSEVVVVARENQDLDCDGLDVSIARDPAEGLGPLAGLAAGLEATSADGVFVASCDQPFLEETIVRGLVEVADRQITVPRIDGRLMMTTAVYHRSVLPAARSLLAARRLRPAFLLETCSSFVVDGLPAGPFRDIDTPEDYAAALRSEGYTSESA